MSDYNGVFNYIDNGQTEQSNKENNLQELKKLVTLLKKNNFAPHNKELERRKKQPGYGFFASYTSRQDIGYQLGSCIASPIFSAGGSLLCALGSCVALITGAITALASLAILPFSRKDAGIAFRISVVAAATSVIYAATSLLNAVLTPVLAVEELTKTITRTAATAREKYNSADTKERDYAPV